MTWRGLSWLIAAAILMSGCIGAEKPPKAAVAAIPEAEAQPDLMSIVGVVVDEDFVPIPGASVQLSPSDAVTSTDPEGRFSFDGVPRMGYRVQASAAGYANQTLLVTPRETSHTLAFTLGPAAADPYHETFQFRGFMECALEVAIISPSCDSILRYANDQMGDGNGVFPEPFKTNSTVDFDTGENWKTVVVDVVFDPDSHAGIDGLRASALGVRSKNDFNTYDKYNDAHGTEPFTLRIDAGKEYGEVPVPDVGTSLRVEVYPQSHGYHATCDAICLLGAGGALNVEFELIITIFYLEPAPEGWTLL